MKILVLPVTINLYDIDGSQMNTKSKTMNCSYNVKKQFILRLRNTLIISLFLPIISFAQVSGPRWYLRAGAGFGFKGFWPAAYSPKTIMPPNSSFDIADGTIQDMTNNVDSIGQKSFVHDTYTKGFNYFLTGGYKLSKYWGVELGLVWLQGGTITSRSVFDNHPLFGSGAVMEVNTYARGLSVVPAVTVDIPLNDNWYIQGQAGLTVPIFGKIYHDAIIDAQHTFLGPMYAVLEAETKPSFTLGVNGGIGIHRKLGQRLEVSLSFLAQHMNLSGKHLTLKKYDLTIQGNTTDQIGANPGAYHSEINFVTELNAQSNNPLSNPNIDETKPKDDLVITSPFSNLDISLGLMFKLGKLTAE